MKEKIAHELKTKNIFKAGRPRFRQVAMEAQIGKLSHADRRWVQMMIGNARAPHNLFYDYDLQVWI